MPLETFRSKYASFAPNPRNLAAGSLRQKHIEAGKGDAADLSFHAYGVMFPGLDHKHPDSPAPPDFNHDSQAIDWLTQNGIAAAGNEVVEAGVDEGIEEAEADEAVAEALLQVTENWARKRDTADWGTRRCRNQTRRIPQTRTARKNRPPPTLGSGLEIPFRRGDDGPAGRRLADRSDRHGDSRRTRRSGESLGRHGREHDAAQRWRDREIGDQCWRQGSHHSSR